MKEDIVDVLNMFLDFRLENIHTVLPGKILSYDESRRLAEVEPLVQLKTSKEVDVKYSVVENVPVIFPSGKSFTLRWDVQKDDGCLILFSEASMGNFINSTGILQIAGEDSSRFSLTDAICIPGLHSVQKAIELSAIGIEIYIDKTGKITVNGNNLDIITTANTLIDATGNTEINGALINLNGNAKPFVTHAELDTALQTFITLLNAHIHTAPTGGGPTTPPTVPMSVNISAAQTTTVKTGG
jgi:hypothetical protein